MPRVNVGRIVLDPRFSQAFTVTRMGSGTWTNGRFSGSTSTLNVTGTIQPATSDDIAQMPEGDFIKGGIIIYTTVPLYTTQLGASNTGSISDEVTWKGEQWRIIQVKDYSDHGYYKALATKKLAA